MSLNETYGGTARSAGTSLATKEPRDGYCSAGVGLLPVVMKTVAGPWEGIVWDRERSMVTLSATWPVLGKCSETWMPSALVAMGLNSPRMPSGAFDLSSHGTRCCGTPPCQ